MKKLLFFLFIVLSLLMIILIYYFYPLPHSHSITIEKKVNTLIKQNKPLDLISLIYTKKVNIDQQFTQQKSLLHLAIDYNQLDIINDLVEEGASLDIQDINGNTPIMYSLMTKPYHQSIFNALLDLQSSLNIQNNKKQYILTLAILSGHVEAFQNLLENNNITQIYTQDIYHKSSIDYAKDAKNPFFYKELNRYIKLHSMEQKSNTN